MSERMSVEVEWVVMDSNGELSVRDTEAHGRERLKFWRSVATDPTDVRLVKRTIIEEEVPHDGQ